MKISETRDRVRLHTAAWKNSRIDRQMEMSIWYFAQNPEQIDERLRELDREWDIERSLESNAAALALTGVLMGILGSRRFFALPTIVAGFLMQHALQGWCPPVPLFRRLGIRTQAEIEAERYALKTLRGDFQKAEEESDIKDRIRQTLQVITAEVTPREARQLH